MFVEEDVLVLLDICKSFVNYDHSKKIKLNIRVS